MNRRVAITGTGIVSCLGTSVPAVGESLRAARSGITRMPRFEALGLPVLIAGSVTGFEALRDASGIKKRFIARMSKTGVFCALAAQQAVTQAGLGEADLRSPRM